MFNLSNHTDNFHTYIFAIKMLTKCDYSHSLMYNIVKLQQTRHNESKFYWRMRYLALLTAMIAVAICPELPLLKNSSQHVDKYE